MDDTSTQFSATPVTTVRNENKRNAEPKHLGQRGGNGRVSGEVRGLLRVPSHATDRKRGSAD